MAHEPGAGAATGPARAPAPGPAARAPDAAALAASASSGLTSAQAAARLAADGPNEIPQERRSGIVAVARDVLREPMFRLLLAAGVVYVLLGDIGEALLLLVFATGSVAITIYQSYRSERALERLRDLSSPRALVVRDGRPQRVAGRDVVRGDRILVAEGDRVPADLLLLEAQDLLVDESTLTGESLPVAKTPPPPGTQAPVPERSHLLSGTLVVRGSATASVLATGRHSQLGQLGSLLLGVEREMTSVHVQTRRLVRLVATLGIGASVVMTLLHRLILGQWMNGVLAGIALAMALLPEEFPLVLTVFFALGAWRMAQRNVLARRPSAIEALGATTALCTDKTGTLTENRMRVAAVSCGGQRHRGEAAWPEATAELLHHAALATKQNPVDPMDRALQECGFGAAPGSERLHEYPFRPDLPLFATVWSQPGNGPDVRIAVKGAPETVARLCGLDDAAMGIVQDEIAALARDGLRVLGVAGTTRARPAPEDPRALRPRWLGLVAFADPLRPTAAAAIAECRDAGIAVRMITGDHPATAATIARQAGIDSGSIVTGAQLDTMTDAALRERIAGVSVFARINPQQKLRIVEALKSNGEVVAMTGDGVNDAPALKAAHIGVAMGGRGTDVAREAASLVLLDDDFSSLVAAVRHGRRIYDNLRKATGFIVAVHVPIAGLAILPLLLGWPTLLHPIHIVFLELIIDPVCSIVFEAQPEEPDIMSRPPRDPQERMFRRQDVVRSLGLGAAALAIVAGVFHAGLAFSLGSDTARSMAFVALVSSNFGLVFAMRRTSGGPGARNGALWRTLLIAGSVLAGVLFVPPLRALFGFGALPALPLAFALLAGPALLVAIRLLTAGATPLHSLSRVLRGGAVP